MQFDLEVLETPKVTFTEITKTVGFNKGTLYTKEKDTNL